MYYVQKYVIQKFEDRGNIWVNCVKYGLGDKFVMNQLLAQLENEAKTITCKPTKYRLKCLSKEEYQNLFVYS